MTDLGRPPTSSSRLVATMLALVVVTLGSYWVWAMATGELVAGMPSWVVGLLMVGLVVALAAAVDRTREPPR